MPCWFIACLCLSAFFTGVSKAGFSGLSLISVALLAWAFEQNGGTSTMQSMGFLLPLLIVADLTVYPAFRQWGSWKTVWPLLVPMLIGVAAAYLLMREMPDSLARPLIGVIILLMLLMQIWKRYAKSSFLRVAHSAAFGGLAGVAGGIATMLANAAGPVIQLFLLGRGYEKMEMIGVGARLFLVVNLIKLPLMGTVGLISVDSLLLNLMAIPFIWIGIWIGRRYLLRVPQKVFEYLILLFASLAVVRLLIP